eukprot:gene13615-9751_t
MEEVEREYAEWKKERKLHPEEIAHQQGCSCTIRKKEKLSEYYFTELLNVSYLGTCAYRRNAASEKFSVCGLFNVHFSRGFLSDFIYYMMNNHSFLSMFMAVRGHPFSRAARRLTYLSANSVTFFMAVLLTKLDPVAAQVVSVLVISPLVILVRKWMFSLLACPCHREVLEREDRNCAYWWYACLGGTGQLLAYFFVCAFVAILLPAAVLTVKTENDHAPQLIIAYAHSVTLASFGQEFIYALLVFWTGEACVTIKLCGSPVLGYGGYFRDKVHILGLRGLRLQMLQLTVMQEQLERRLEREAQERRRLEALENGYAASPVDAAAAAMGGVAADDVEDDQLPPAEFRRSVSVRDIPPSILHQYDYAIQEMEWLRYLTCGAIQVEFYVSIPFIREFVREFKDEYADMDDDRSAQYSQETTVGIELEDAALPDKLVSTVVDKWNRLFTTSTTDSRPVSTASLHLPLPWDLQLPPPWDLQLPLPWDLQLPPPWDLQLPPPWDLQLPLPSPLLLQRNTMPMLAHKIFLSATETITSR